MREVWSTAAEAAREKQRPLSTARWPEVVLLMGQSSVASSYWQKQFVEWITDEPELAVFGARGLAALGGLTHPSVPPLVTRIARQPTNFSLDALDELVRAQRDSPEFVADALALLRNFAAAPDVYDLLEKELLFAMTGAGSGQTLRAVEKLLAQHAELPPMLRETLVRAKQTLRSATAENLLRDEGPT
jgi:hypothetical protein